MYRAWGDDVVSRFDAGGMIPEGFETRPSGRKTAAGVIIGGGPVLG